MKNPFFPRAFVTARLPVFISLALMPIISWAAEFKVSDAAELEAALIAAQANAEADTIVLDADIDLKDSLPALKGVLAIDGQGYQLKGKQEFRILTITGGEVKLKNLDIVDGKAQGANGGEYHYGGGSGGAAGMGGGIFIHNGKVHLKQVHFIGNQAIGGTGGSYTETDLNGKGADGAHFDLLASINTAAETNTDEAVIERVDAPPAPDHLRPDFSPEAIRESIRAKANKSDVATPVPQTEKAPAEAELKAEETPEPSRARPDFSSEAIKTMIRAKADKTEVTAPAPAAENKQVTPKPVAKADKPEPTPTVTQVIPLERIALKPVYHQGGEAAKSGGLGQSGDFGSGGGGGGSGTLDGGFGGMGGFGGGGGGGGYGFGFADTHYGTDLKQNTLLDHGDNRGEGGFAAGFGGLGGFADDSSGGAGGGGAGLGGAIFIQQGELKLEQVRFSDNVARGGQSGDGKHQGENGEGHAGALFICSKAKDARCNAMVRSCQPPVYTNNSATHGDADVLGELLPVDCTPPPPPPAPKPAVTADAIPKAAVSVPMIPINRKTFTWQGEKVAAWSLWLGGNIGERNIHDSGSLAPEAKVTVDNLPVDGSFMFARLWYSKNNQHWYYRDYRYNLRVNQWVEITAPSLLSNNPDNIIYGKHHTFHWQGSGIEQWRLSIGNRKGAADIHHSANLNHETEVSVDNLPADGRTIYIRLWFWHKQHRSWQLLDYQYSSEPALMQIVPDMAVKKPHD